MLKGDETAARNSLTRRAVVFAAGVGGISAWLGSLLTPTIGITVCAYGLFGVGFLTGKAWKRKSLPPDGSERRRALASGGLAVFVFSLAVYPVPAIDAFRHSLFRGTALWSVLQVVILALVMVTLAYMVRAGMALQLRVPFCASCKTWACLVRLRASLDCEKDELKERLLAEDFRYLSTSVSAGPTKEYVFDFTTCECDSVQKVRVSYDPSPGDETPLQGVINMPLTRTKVENFKQCLPLPDSTDWHYQCAAFFGMAVLVWVWFFAWMNLLGLEPF